MTAGAAKVSGKGAHVLPPTHVTVTEPGRLGLRTGALRESSWHGSVPPLPSPESGQAARVGRPAAQPWDLPLPRARPTLDLTAKRGSCV